MNIGCERYATNDERSRSRQRTMRALRCSEERRGKQSANQVHQGCFVAISRRTFGKVGSGDLSWIKTPSALVH